MSDVDRAARRPPFARIGGEPADLQEARDGTDKPGANAAERSDVQVQNTHEKLTEFIESVSQCAEKGAPPTDAKCPPREVDARYAPVLDDGVMINSAALWPLLDPQWNHPKTWYKELATAKPGAKDYDWSQLAARYWPSRVDGKCRKDPSLGVAHGCFWRYHPARAWAWELRLQDEIGPDFRIDEPNSDACRSAYLSENGLEALATVEKEVLRRMGRGKDKKIVPEMRLLESGLWAAHPEACWALEGRMIERQEGTFVLDAPDADVERARYGEGNPDRVAERRQVMARWEGTGELFGVEV